MLYMTLLNTSYNKCTYSKTSATTTLNKLPHHNDEYNEDISNMEIN